jgi:hypothetical protein
MQATMVSQYFETTIVSNGYERAIRFIFTPANQLKPTLRSLFESSEAEKWRSEEAYSSLGIDIHGRLHFPEDDAEP